MDLPDARSDGLCCDCVKGEAVTTDKRFCRSCLRDRMNHANPIDSMFNDGIGRKPGGHWPDASGEEPIRDYGDER